MNAWLRTAFAVVEPVSLDGIVLDVLLVCCVFAVWRKTCLNLWHQLKWLHSALLHHMTATLSKPYLDLQI